MSIEPIKYDRGFKTKNNVWWMGRWFNTEAEVLNSKEYRVLKAAVLADREARKVAAAAKRAHLKATTQSCSQCGQRVPNAEATTFRQKAYCSSCWRHYNQLCDMVSPGSGSGKRVVRSTRGL